MARNAATGVRRATGIAVLIAASLTTRTGPVPITAATIAPVAAAPAAVAQTPGDPAAAIDALVAAWAAGKPIIEATFPSEAAWLTWREPVLARAKAWREQWNPAAVGCLLGLSLHGLMHDWRDAVQLVRTAEEIVTGRPVPADGALSDFEMTFHRAALAGLIGARALTAAQDYATRLDARLALVSPTGPATTRWSDGRLALLRGTIDEAWTAPGVGSVQAKDVSILVARADRETRQRLERAVAGFAQAATAPAVAGEARVRQAFALHRLGRHAEALSVLGAGGITTEDVAVGYWGALVRGRTLDALGRTREAIDAYRDALALVPGAQTPHVALAVLYERLGQADAARAEAETAQRPTGGRVVDPWWQYWSGDLRLVSGWLADLQRMAS